MVSVNLRPSFHRVQHSLARSEWLRLGAMALSIATLHILGFALLFTASSHRTASVAFGLGTGLLAYGLGMRHAFDADHIAAIDGTTRKLIGERQRPLSVGFFFSLGHSSVVLFLALLLNFGLRAFNHAVISDGSTFRTWTALIGTTVSGLFLYGIAAMNLVVLVSIIRVTKKMRAGTYDEESLDDALANRGIMTRVTARLARKVDRPGKMFVVGLLFGLGFDTASEIALLVLAGSAVVSGLSLSAVLSLPILFAAGMCLFDTIDGCFMNFAYGWAFSTPSRKLFYNLTMTSLSVVVAVFVGTVELFSLLAQHLGLHGSFWTSLSAINPSTAGFAIVLLFVLIWVVAILTWHFGDIENKWSAHDVASPQPPSPPPVGALQ